MSDDQRRRLERLAAAPDAEIDTSDIREVLDWSGTVRGGLSRTPKEAVPIGRDADVLAWFRGHSTGEDGYQSEINRVLRRHVAASGGEAA